jgi:hypothetical protein
LQAQVVLRKKVALMMATASTTIQGPRICFPLPSEQKLEGATLLLQNWFLTWSHRRWHTV